MDNRIIKYQAKSSLRLARHASKGYVGAHSKKGFDLKPGDRIKLLPERSVRNMKNYKKGFFYFKIISSSNKNADKSKLYYSSQKSFESALSDNKFGKKVMHNILKKKNTPRKQKSIPMQEKREYKMGDNTSPIKLYFNLIPAEKVSLRPGEKFYLIRKPRRGNKERIVLKKPGFSAEYDIVDRVKFDNAFKNGNVLPGKYLPRKKKKTHRKVPPIEAVRKISQIGEVSKKTAPEHSDCFSNSTSAQSIFSKCKGNSYADNLIKSLGLDSPGPLNSDKLCILASLKMTPGAMKVAKCNQSGDQLNKKHPKKGRVCHSEIYVNYIHDEISNVLNCFENISMKEIIPLINNESRFNYNAYNYFRGRLNASGPLQITQELVDTQKESLIQDTQLKDTQYCRNLKNLPPLTKNKNVCSRTAIPDRLKKHLFVSVAQYKYFKDGNSELKSEINARNLFNILNENKAAPFFKVKSKKERERIITDIARLMHNRGNQKIFQLLLLFNYDLKNGQYLSKKQKRYLRKSYFRRGNPTLHKLLKNKKISLPLSRETFIEFFSSYLFYETKYKRRNTKRGAADKKGDEEVGTYLYRIACDQKRLNLKANKLAKKIHFPEKNINCGSDPLSKKILKNVNVQVAWYVQKCGPTNRGFENKIEICSTKNPYTTKSIGRDKNKNRNSEEELRDYETNPRYLRSCSSKSLRGLVARPLIQYYSTDPKAYE